MPPIQPLYACAPPPPLSVPLQGRGETPSSNFNCERLCSSAIWIDYLARLASLSALSRSYSSSSSFSLASSSRRASSSSSSRAWSSFALHLALRDRLTPYYTFRCARVCSSPMVMVRDACVSWKRIVLWHLTNWHDCRINSIQLYVSPKERLKLVLLLDLCPQIPIFDILCREEGGL